MTRFRNGLVAGILGLAAASASAQPSPVAWQYLGPGSLGSMSSVAAHPSDADRAYFGSHLGRGVLQTTDGGATWSASSNGLSLASEPDTSMLSVRFVDGFAFDPIDPDILYAAGDRGLFRRMSDASPWVDLRVPTVWPLHAVAVAKTSPQIVFTAGFSDGPYKSTDGGKTWANVVAGLPYANNIYSIVIDPGNADVVYIAINGSGVYKSTSGGAQWSKASVGLADSFGPANPWVLALDSKNPQTLYAATARGVFKTTNAAASWTLCLAGDFNTIAIDPVSSQNVLAGSNKGGVYRSTDGGAIWTPAIHQGGGAVVWGLAIAPASPNVVYGATFSGLLERSGDGGANFVYADRGLYRSTLLALTADPSTPGTLYAGGSNLGIFKSATAGESWKPITVGSNPNTSVFDIAIDPTDPTTLYAGAGFTGGVYKSVNRGETWAPSNSGLPSNSQARCLAIHPSAPDTVFAGLGSGGVYKSANNGVQWTAANSGLPSGSVSALAIDPSNPNLLYAGIGPGVFRSTNGGSSWSPSQQGLPATGSVEDLLVLPHSPSTLFAGTTKGLFRSSDAGGTWSPVAGGLPANAFLRALRFDPGVAPGRRLLAGTTIGAYSIDLSSSPPAIYAGLLSGGIYQSVDGGATWAPFNRGFANGITLQRAPILPEVYSLAVGRWRLVPDSLVVDAATGPGSNGNGIVEPGETVAVETGWRNETGAPLALKGLASDGILDAEADYGTIPAGGRASCAATHNCYSIDVPEVDREHVFGHLDMQLTETLRASDPAKAWRLHLGDSFTDVPRSYPFYKKIETVFHNGLAVGCGGNSYCPSDKVPRDQMALFMARGLAGGGSNVPSKGEVSGAAYNCATGGTSLFDDVAATDIFCKSVHYLAAQNVTTGCSPGQYCPGDLISRASMAIFVAKAMVAPGGGAAVPQAYGPDPVTGLSYSCSASNPNLHFQDVAVSDSFCKHAHYLWARGVISGCGTDRYCPAGDVARDEMAKFLSNAFGLGLYGP